MPNTRAGSHTTGTDDRVWLGDIERGTGAARPQGQLASMGPFSALLVGTELRYVCLGEREIVRRVYVAVRDADWGTIGAFGERVDNVDGPEGTEWLMEAEHVGGGLDYAWRGGATGSRSSMTFSMTGTCRTRFDFNRIGICVLLPPFEYAGAAYTLAGPDGEASGQLPQLVGPQAIIDGEYKGVVPPFHRFLARLPDGLEVTLSFSGEAFEMEDQRNWTDASFKIYSTPLSHPRPQRAERGDVIRQQVTVTIRDL